MPQLDALRAAAVSAVMAHHFLPISRYVPEDYVNLGVFAVRMFFVLSGFLITGILLRARGEEPKTALKQFYLRRVLRIFPIYYLALFAALAFGLGSIQERAWWHLTYLTNFIYPFHPELTWPASHFWTLAVEEQFYLVWPFILIFLPGKHLFKAIVGIVVLAVLFRAVVLYAFDVPEVAAVWTFGALDSLGLGALLAMFRHDEALRPHLKKFLGFCLFAGLTLLVLLTLMLLFNRGYRVVYVGRYLCLSLLFVVLIDRASRGFKGKLKLLLEWPPVLYVGRISYGLYVYHLFAFAAVVAFCHMRWGGTPHYLIVAAVSTVLTFLTSIVSWHLIERPITDLKNRFSFGRPAPRPTAPDELTVNTDAA
jgi:peptidoglycan/LPS O-acetylase OafA/YrhL